MGSSRNASIRPVLVAVLASAGIAGCVARGAAAPAPSVAATPGAATQGAPSARASVEEGLATLLTHASEGGERGSEVYVTAVEGVAYVIANGSETASASLWLQDVVTRPDATLISGGRSQRLRAEIVDDPERLERVRAAMTEKYGAYEAWVAWLPVAGAPVLVRLTPL